MFDWSSILAVFPPLGATGKTARRNQFCKINVLANCYSVLLRPNKFQNCSQVEKSAKMKCASDVNRP